MPAVLLVGGRDDPAVAALSERGHDLRYVPHDGVAVEHAADVDCAVVSAGPGDLAVVEAFAGARPDLPIVFARGEDTADEDAGDEDGVSDDTGDEDAAGDGRAATRPTEVGAALECGADDHVYLGGEDATERLAARVERLAGPPGPEAASPYRTDGDRAGSTRARRAPDADSRTERPEPDPFSGPELEPDDDPFRSALENEETETEAPGSEELETGGLGTGELGPEEPGTEGFGPGDSETGELGPEDPDTEGLGTGAPETETLESRVRSDVDSFGTEADQESGEDRIRTLLESAGALMDAEDAESTAETIVTAAEQALGYDLVAVHLLDDEADTLEPVAVTDRKRDAVRRLEDWSTTDHPAGEAIRDDRPVELDAETLGDHGASPLDTTFVVPLGGHGTLSFTSMGDDGFDDGDRRVAELLAANATVALDRIERLERLERLHHATQTMLDARSPDAVAERAVEAATSILGRQFVRFHRYEVDDTSDGEVLAPVAWTDEFQLTVGEPAAIDASSDGPWGAFEENRVIRSDQPTSAAGDDASFESQLYVPIGDHGLLVVGAPDPETFDGTDVQVARLLATNTARTLDRVERTQELERYQSVFETVSDMVYVLDQKGFITHCTPALARRLGYRRSELLGKHVSQLVDDDALQEIASIADRLLDRGSSTARTQRIDLQTVHDEEIPVQIDISMLPGEGYSGVVGTIREISDLLAVREQLNSQQDRFEYLFENIPDPVVETNHEDGKATAVSVNPAFVETFGFDADELRDRPLNDVIVPDEKRKEADLLDERLAEGEIHQTEIERETQYGLREFLFRGVPYTASDGTTRAFAIYTDITEQRERERHLDVLQRILRHNVRNDVNVLLGGLDKFEKDGLDDATLQTLQGSAHDLLSMSKKAKRISHVLEADREQLGTIDLTTLTRDVVEQYRDSGDAEIVADLPPTCPVVGSRTIARAIEELVGNAVQHAGEHPTVEISISVQGQRASVTVADDGPGIPEQERLVLQEDEITPVQHGSGLGLWLVKHATTASGGAISFGEPTEGGSVTLSFRRAEEAATAAAR